MDKYNDDFYILTENAPFGIVVIARDGTYKYINGKFKKTFGYNLKDIPNGKTWFRKAYPDPSYRKMVLHTWIKDLETFRQKNISGERTPYTFTVKCKDGSEKIINFIPVELNTGDTLVSCEDVTEKKMAEMALIKAREVLEERVKERTSELEMLNRRLLDIIEFLPDATFVIDKDKKVIAWNRAIEEMTGTTKEAIIGMGDYAYAVPFYGEKRPMLIDLLFDKELKTDFTYDFIKRKGNIIFGESFLPKINMGKGMYCWGIASLLFDKNGNINGAIESLRDITERKVMEKALRRSEEKYRLIFENSIEGIFQTTTEGCFLSANPALASMLGFSSPEEMIETCKDISHEIYANPHDRKEFLERLNKYDTLQAFETRLYRKDKSIIWVSLNSRSVRDESGKVMYYEGTIEDITERKEAEEIIKRLAYYDALTGLPNRPLFNDRLSLAMSNADRNKKKVAVMLLDLDRFKQINDTLGHNAGDELLKSVSNRLLKILRKSDTVARMGGDEFLIIVPGISFLEYVESVARKIVNSFRESFIVNGNVINVTTSIGIAIYPDDGRDVETLIKLADISMYEAKKTGRNDYNIYNEGLKNEILEKTSITGL
ncbi:MAG TPA: diguanylate cyclase [Syntrophorhabdaceae bacterium]|nr:diguanylate cyclase [Syntrophorhabdaceae bacterium]